MSVPLVRLVDVLALRAEGRAPLTPFRVELEDGSEIVFSRLLRVLPGKRVVAVAQWKTNGGSQRVLAKFFIAENAARHWAKEKAGIERLQQAAVRTPELLLASPAGQGGYVLLTRFLDGAQSLAQLWSQVADYPAGHSECLDLLCPAFSLLGRLHASGLLHDDLHFGNFLVDNGRCWLIDGDAVRAISLGRALPESLATANLALLLAQLPVAWDDARAQLLGAYAETAQSVVIDLRALEQQIVKARNWRLNDYLKKTTRDCSLFAVSHNALRFTVLRRDSVEALMPMLNDIDQAIASGDQLKDGRTSTVVRVSQAGRSIVIKRYNLKNRMHAMSRLWRPSRAWHSWREGHRLGFFGIATPLPLALVEERWGPFRRRAFLVNEHCPGADLWSLLSAHEVPTPPLANGLVVLFTTLCRLRISHGDLKATNLLWHDGRVVVIDLDALTQHRSAASHLRAWRRDRARLLRNWPEGSPLHAWLDANLPASNPQR